MSVAVQPDPVRRRVVVTVPSGSRWSGLVCAVLEAVERWPELTDWNWIIDDQGPMDDTDVAGMTRIGDAFVRLRGAASGPTHTVVVTTDRFFGSWAPVIDANFGGRRHYAVPTLKGAMALLDRLEASAKTA